MNILVTGGAGYIGSHTCVSLLESGHEIIVMDNYSNSSPEVNDRVKEISGKSFLVYECDMTDKNKMELIFKENKIDAVIHFAGLKAVGESVSQPLRYYQNNISGTINLLELMEQYGVYQMVFSSSATVYGMNNEAPFSEDMPLSATNPYGQTKLMIETILCDLCVANDKWQVALLRYFNPIGAHKSGLIGERPNGIPNNLMPYITGVASGELKCLKVYGNDYPTPDGTGVRDYIHVCDLAEGHLKAIEKMPQIKGAQTYNLGTGRGNSVLEVVAAFEKASGVAIKYEMAPRRAGDIATCYADVEKAKQELGFETKRDIEEMCADSWHFIRKQKKI